MKNNNNNNKNNLPYVVPNWWLGKPENYDPNYKKNKKLNKKLKKEQPKDKEDLISTIDLKSSKRLINKKLRYFKQGDKKKKPPRQSLLTTLIKLGGKLKIDAAGKVNKGANLSKLSEKRQKKASYYSSIQQKRLEAAKRRKQLKAERAKVYGEYKYLLKSGPSKLVQNSIIEEFSLHSNLQQNKFVTQNNQLKVNKWVESFFNEKLSQSMDSIDLLFNTTVRSKVEKSGLEELIQLKKKSLNKSFKKKINVLHKLTFNKRYNSLKNLVQKSNHINLNYLYRNIFFLGLPKVYNRYVFLPIKNKENENNKKKIKFQLNQKLQILHFSFTTSCLKAHYFKYSVDDNLLYKNQLKLTTNFLYSNFYFRGNSFNLKKKKKNFQYNKGLLIKNYFKRIKLINFLKYNNKFLLLCFKKNLMPKDSYYYLYDRYLKIQDFIHEKHDLELKRAELIDYKNLNFWFKNIFPVINNISISEYPLRKVFFFNTLVDFGSRLNKNNFLIFNKKLFLFLFKLYKKIPNNKNRLKYILLFWVILSLQLTKNPDIQLSLPRKFWFNKQNCIRTSWVFLDKIFLFLTNVKIFKALKKSKESFFNFSHSKETKKKKAFVNLLQSEEQKKINFVEKRLEEIQKLHKDDWTTPIKTIEIQTHYKKLFIIRQGLMYFYGKLKLSFLYKIYKKEICQKRSKFRLLNFILFFERSLFMVLYRLKLVPSIKLALHLTKIQLKFNNKFSGFGNFLINVNHKNVFSPFYQLKPGDIIYINPQLYKRFLVTHFLQNYFNKKNLNKTLLINLFTNLSSHYSYLLHDWMIRLDLKYQEPDFNFDNVNYFQWLDTIPQYLYKPTCAPFGYYCRDPFYYEVMKIYPIPFNYIKFFINNLKYII